MCFFQHETPIQGMKGVLLIVDDNIYVQRQQQGAISTIASTQQVYASVRCGSLVVDDDDVL